MSEDAESRILLISASLDQARAAVKLIKAFVDDPSELPTSDIIPWTIRNKYYSADVHFHLVEFSHWNPQSALRVPAVIFVWTRGQPYAEHVFALQNGLARFEPEVALAIGLGCEPPHYDDPPEGPDSFLADHGFEYIDGERTHHPEMPSASVTEENDGDGGGDEEDVQGLPRVIDALSTIMWPTMVRERDNNGGGKHKSQLRPSLVDFDDVLRAGDGEMPGDEEETLAALMEADAADLGVPLTRTSRMQREMQALERWLIENEEMHEAEFGRTGIDDDDDVDADEAGAHEEEVAINDNDSGDALSSFQAPLPDIRTPSGDDPWAAALSTSNSPPSTTLRSTAPPSSGFDDNFSAFVSAPPVCGLASASILALGSTPPAHHHLHTPSPTLLKPSLTGGSSRSLRSAVSDVDIGDDVGYGYEALDDRSSFSPDHEHERMRVFGDDADPRTSTDRRFGGQAAGLGDEPFDLANILGTLTTMREDMAGIEDEEERKATTARFASEFVFKSMGMDEEERGKIES